MLRRIHITLTLLLPLLATPHVAAQGVSKSNGQVNAKTEQAQFFFDGDTNYPLWDIFYHDNFSSARVRLRTLSMDSLPDEINLKLVKDSTEFCFPVKNIITSPYGWRERWGRPHRGVDILLHTGDPVRSAFSGVVRVASYMGDYGNLIVIRHPNGLETCYGHLSKILVKPRQFVNAGDVIGLGGNTGHSTGPHLHFEVRFQYEPFDPEWILDFKNYKLRTRRLHLDKTYFGITRPKGKKTPIFKADQSIIAERPMRKQRKEVHYNIKHSDSLERIALLHSTTVEQLKELNPKLKKLTPGLQIRIR